MAYLSPRFQAEDKTTDREKMQQQFRATLLANRPQEMDKSSYRRRADYIAETGNDQTAFEIAKRTKREQARIEAARRKMEAESARNIETSVGQGVGPNLRIRGGGGKGNAFKPTGNTSFDKFMAAISGQESNGDYTVVNGDSGAMGKYQIMPGNINGKGRGWDFEALGRDVSRSEFLNSPALQEAIASHQMKKYYDKWGPRGAAIAWYAGPGAVTRNPESLNAPQGKYPSINGYVAAILRRLGL